MIKPSSSPLFYRFKRWIAAQQCKLFDRALEFVLARHPLVKRSNLVAYSREELRRAGHFGDGGLYRGMIGRAVLRQVQLFALEGHSGGSASIARSTAHRVLAFNPLTELTGDDDEWNECGPGVFQNKRCSSIFKENGKAYRLDGRVFREPSGSCYTSRDSRVPVFFPWAYSEPEIVDVSAKSR